MAAGPLPVSLRNGTAGWPGCACGPAYRLAVENSADVAAGGIGGGTGSAFLGALIPDCAACGVRLMAAAIGDSVTHASIGLHARAGFVRAGLLPAIGWKHGRWPDRVPMARPPDPGSATPPEG